MFAFSFHLQLLSLCYAERTVDRDYFMSAEEAREFGVIDEVIKHRTGDQDGTEHAGSGAVS